MQDHQVIMAVENELHPWEAKGQKQILTIPLALLVQNKVVEQVQREVVLQVQKEAVHQVQKEVVSQVQTLQDLTVQEKVKNQESLRIPEDQVGTIAL